MNVEPASAKATERAGIEHPTLNIERWGSGIGLWKRDAPGRERMMNPPEEMARELKRIRISLQVMLGLMVAGFLGLFFGWEAAVITIIFALFAAIIWTVFSAVFLRVRASDPRRHLNRPDSAD